MTVEVTGRPTKVKDLKLPHVITVETREGEAGVVIYKTPDIPYLRTGGCDPYLWDCEKIEVWGDMDGDTTVEEVKSRVEEALPNYPDDYQHVLLKKI